MSGALTAHSTVTLAGDAMEAEVDGEVVALSVERGVCYGLNPTGSRIWRLIAGPARIADICDVLVKEYEVGASECERQVLDLLEELRAEQLVVVVE